MSKEDAIEEYQILKSEILKHNKAYYENDKPLISDYEYDVLMKKMELLEIQYPELKIDETVTQKVGGVASQKFQKVAHNVPMLSLSNTYNIGEIEDFDNRIKKILENTAVNI